MKPLPIVKTKDGLVYSTWSDFQSEEKDYFWSLFVFFYLSFSFLLGLISLPFFIEIIHIDPKISGAIPVPVIVAISYLGQSRFSFAEG